MRGTIRPSQWAGEPCPECGELFVSEGGMAGHRAREHGARAYSARRFDADAKKALDRKPRK